MDIKNLEALPADAGKVVSGFVGDILEVYGEDVVSVFVYGSVTGADYDPASSDINIAVVLKDTSIRNLKPSLKAVRKGIKKKINAPLFLSKEYISRSMDTFPVEFMLMKSTGKVLYGEDVLSPLEAGRQDIRRECEYQIKGKLLTMRQAYLEQGLSHKGMEKLIKASLRALVPVFQGVLMIDPVSPVPSGKIDTVRELGKRFDLDLSLLLEAMADNKTDGLIGKYNAEEFLQKMISGLEELSDIVDGL